MANHKGLASQNVNEIDNAAPAASANFTNKKNMKKVDKALLEGAIDRANAAPAASVEQTVTPANDEIDIEKEFELMDITQHEATHGKAIYESTEELNLNNDVMAGGLDFTLDIDKPSVKQAYDNAGAYGTLLSIMERSSNINVEFRLDKENYHYAWIEAKGVAGFKYYLKNEAFNGIIKYLTKGEVADFDPVPLEYEKAKFTDDFYIMKLFVDKGIILQCTPLFRERIEYVTAFLPCRKGKITFRVKRTDDIVNYLREAGQCL